MEGFNFFYDLLWVIFVFVLFLALRWENGLGLRRPVA